VFVINLITQTKEKYRNGRRLKFCAFIFNCFCSGAVGSQGRQVSYRAAGVVTGEAGVGRKEMRGAGDQSQQTQRGGGLRWDLIKN